jgi:hypothetical protein
MSMGRFIAVAVLAALLGTAAIPAEKIVPRAGLALAPLPTDEAVRKGMVTIRDLVSTNHSLITYRRMPPDHAMRFAAQVKVEADQILATSNLSGEARDKLRALLEEIVTGIGAVAKPDAGVSPMDGLERADAALTRYPQEFDHPGWAPAKSLN